jgi:hypothetical protein
MNDITNEVNTTTAMLSATYSRLMEVSKYIKREFGPYDNTALILEKAALAIGKIGVDEVIGLVFFTHQMNNEKQQNNDRQTVGVEQEKAPT